MHLKTAALHTAEPGALPFCKLGDGAVQFLEKIVFVLDMTLKVPGAKPVFQAQGFQAFPGNAPVVQSFHFFDKAVFQANLQPVGDASAQPGGVVQDDQNDRIYPGRLRCRRGRYIFSNFNSAYHAVAVD